MSDVDNKWSYNFQCDGVWDNDLFDTRAEAIEAAKHDKDFKSGQVVYIGETKAIELINSLDAEHIIEDTAHNTQDDNEYEGVLDCVYDAISDEARDDLQTRLDAVWEQWLLDNEIKLSCYDIVNTEELILGKDNS